MRVCRPPRACPTATSPVPKYCLAGSDVAILGGKHFSRDLRPLDAEGNEISMWSADAQKKLAAGLEEGDEESEDSEEESDDEPGEPQSAAAASREERKKEKKARKEAAAARARGQAVQVGDLPPSDSESEDSDGDMPANPNHSSASRNQAKAVASVADATDGVKNMNLGTPNRRERETLEAQQAKERYRKLQEQGKTDDAKADLARLKVIREKREAEAARKQVRVDIPTTSRIALALLSIQRRVPWSSSMLNGTSRPKRKRGRPRRPPRRSRSKPKRRRSERLLWARQRPRGRNRLKKCRGI